MSFGPMACLVSYHASTIVIIDASYDHVRTVYNVFGSVIYHVVWPWMNVQALIVI